VTKLVIVESPSKAKTITKYLGKGYKVMASVGHIRDLPTKEAVEVSGKKVPVINVAGDFQELYEIPATKAKVVAGLRAAAKGVDELILATDPDREGEAISWHLLEAIKPPKGLKVKRVLFNEITQNGIQKAMAAPTEVNQQLVDAQRARRVLDRIVGYKVSQVLWDKVKRGLSAGRVQSVALRLIVDREHEIQAFKPIEYWVLRGKFAAKLPPQFWMKFVRLNGQALQLGNKETKARIKNEKQAHGLRDQILKAAWKVTGLETKEKKRNAPAPFTTAKLQQEAANKLGFSVSRTMQNAQRLYEGVDFGEGPVGLITYMRTDSPRLAPEAIEAAREYVQKKWGKDYLPAKAKIFAGKSGAQDAHEAIRPTDISRAPESLRGHLGNDEFRLYALIWRRTVACQMEAARFDETVVAAESALESGEMAAFEAKGEIERFPGWLAAYRADKVESAAEQMDSTSEEEEEENIGLPDLKKGETLKLETLETDQQFTKPPARYSEATLVKELEEDGIGRPSTYASIIATIQNRDYVKKVEGRFKPTEIGMAVTDLLVQGFPELMDPRYTSGMEDQLDRIEGGEISYEKMLKTFYGPFEKLLKSASKDMANLKAGVPTDVKCKKCKSVMLKRYGKNGLFLGCSKYPDCDHTEELPKSSNPWTSLRTPRNAHFAAPPP